MHIFDNHQKLFGLSLALFLLLTLFVAILPAIKNEENNAPLPNAKPLSPDAIAGKKIYIANGCVACHTQQVRNVDMDKSWGQRPSIAADYADIGRTDFWTNTATLMGTERTGPDLTDIGHRQPSEAWHLLHLFQPRATVEGSIMPAYPWLFKIKDKLEQNDVEVVIPQNFRQNINGKIVATKEARQLVAYLQHLQQTTLPDGQKLPEFLYPQSKSKTTSNNASVGLPDGQMVYANNCQSCHQANGEGLLGAFPALKNSPIVVGNDIDLYVRIIMKGYDARPEFAVMPAVGENNKLNASQITALINHERSSWGNKAPQISLNEIEKILASIKDEK